MKEEREMVLVKEEEGRRTERWKMVGEKDMVGASVGG